MKILHITYSKNGGAGTSAYRLHKLLSKEIDSIFITTSDIFKDKHALFDNQIITPELTLKNYLLEKFFHRFSKKKKELEILNSEIHHKISPNYTGEFEIFSTPFSNIDITKLDSYSQCDIVHLHWVSGLLDFESFFKFNKKPIVWTFHDENPFMGAFHYEADQIRNEENLSNVDNIYKSLKKSAYEGSVRLNIVSPSKWLLRKAVESEMFFNATYNHQYYCLDFSVFKVQEKLNCRQIFNLPLEGTIFSFASADVKNKRKGLDLLLPFFSDPHFADVNFLIIGRVEDELADYPNVFCLGTLESEILMSIAYSASDFFILPSREDNLPNTMLEALCCGIPVVAFDISDNRDLIESNDLGFICESISSESLKTKLLDCIDNKHSFSRDKVSMTAKMLFESDKCLKFYTNLYQNILDENINHNH